jgi:CheY-like chemotaxis protein
MTPLEKYPVLFAEDDTTDVFLVERAIHKASLPIQLHVVCNGREAISYLAGEAQFANRSRYPLPMLLLSNLRMPKMNGLELLTWIRQQPDFKDLPVVVMSGSRDPRQIGKFDALEVSFYSLKPAVQSDLIAILQRAISLLPPLR